MNRRDLALAAIRGRVLDVGCGELNFIWQFRPPPQVTLLDLGRAPWVHVQAAAEHLPVRNRSFDTVLLLEILEHVDDVRIVVNEARRVARDRVVASYPNDAATDHPPHTRAEILAGLQKWIDLGFRPPVASLTDLHAFHHWKPRSHVEADVAWLSSLAAPIDLDYGEYPGFGFVIPARPG